MGPKESSSNKKPQTILAIVGIIVGGIIISSFIFSVDSIDSSSIEGINQSEILQLESDRNYLTSLETEKEIVAFVKQIIKRPDTVNTCKKILDKIESVRWNEDWDFNTDGTISQDERNLAFVTYNFEEIEDVGKTCMSISILFPEIFE